MPARDSRPGRLYRAGMIARYLPPGSPAVRESPIGSEQDLDRVLAEAAALRTERGIPAVEFVVPPALGRSAARELLATGSPFVPELSMEPDWLGA